MSVAAANTPDRGHAVIIGASMAGLTAAAAVAPYYDRVTVLERDQLPDEADHRRGVPQSRHAHALQPGGLRALEQLLPGLVDELLAAGAPMADACGMGHWTVGGNRFAQADADVAGIGITRPFLERAVRTRVTELPNVTIRDRVEVDGLLAANPGSVTGVVLRAADGGRGGGPEELAADLVVDASGKASRLSTWLGALGYDHPAEEAVHCKMAYVSRRWRLAEANRPDDIVVVVTPAERPHFGVLIPQEDGTHIATVGGLFNSAPERTDAAYLEFAGNLADGSIGRALIDAEPVTELQTSHFPASRRLRYDRMRSFPTGVLAIGDAIASFNPMYGQGMTVASLEAVALKDLLAQGPLDARSFFKRAHRIEDVAWKVATGGDLRFPEVEGRRGPDTKIMNRYLDRLTAAAQHDAVLAGQFLRVAGFVDPPSAFFKPTIVRRVLRRRRPASAAPAAGQPRARSRIKSES